MEDDGERIEDTLRRECNVLYYETQLLTGATIMVRKTLFLILLLLLSFRLSAQDAAKPDQNKPEFKPEFPKETVSESKHSATINEKLVNYTVRAGNIVLKEENGKPKASFFFIAYTKDGITDVGTRSITFAFNGGPGSSSVWLHLGVLGPRRVAMADDGSALPPPYKLTDNNYSILDVTDLVFIDPISTGYSRPVPGEEAQQYHGVQEDIESVGKFIRLWTTRYQRWASPKFLCGESYGTTRAAGLAGYLQQEQGMYLNGVILVSAVLDFATGEFVRGNDLPFITFLPTYTATAWYHKQLPPDLQANLSKTLHQVESFALNEYTLALMKGDALSATERMSVVDQLSRFTGLPKEYIEQTNLRIYDYRFTKELLRDQGIVVGRLDSRFKGYDYDSAGESGEADPSYSAILGSFTATLNNYVRTDLKYESDLPYEILTNVYPWDYGRFKNQYVNVSEPLRTAMTQNPYLKVFVANGYYDLATPYFATKYTFDHLGLPSIYKSNVSMGYYESGHMMYINKPSLILFKADLSNFILSSTGK
jgi:carboxypeptidase C (cathepsin A)